MTDIPSTFSPEIAARGDTLLARWREIGLTPEAMTMLLCDDVFRASASQHGDAQEFIDYLRQQIPQFSQPDEGLVTSQDCLQHLCELSPEELDAWLVAHDFTSELVHPLARVQFFEHFRQRPEYFSVLRGFVGNIYSPEEARALLFTLAHQATPEQAFGIFKDMAENRFATGTLRGEFSSGFMYPIEAFDALVDKMVMGRDRKVIKMFIDLIQHPLPPMNEPLPALQYYLPHAQIALARVELLDALEPPVPASTK